LSFVVALARRVCKKWAEYIAVPPLQRFDVFDRLLRYEADDVALLAETYVFDYMAEYEPEEEDDWQFGQNVLFRIMDYDKPNLFLHVRNYCQATGRMASWFLLSESGPNCVRNLCRRSSRRIFNLFTAEIAGFSFPMRRTLFWTAMLRSNWDFMANLLDKGVVSLGDPHLVSWEGATPVACHRHDAQDVVRFMGVAEGLKTRPGGLFFLRNWIDGLLRGPRAPLGPPWDDKGMDKSNIRSAALLATFLDKPYGAMCRVASIWKIEDAHGPYDHICFHSEESDKDAHDGGESALKRTKI